MDGKLYDKKKIHFQSHSINEKEVEEVPILFVDGMLGRYFCFY
jgi:hypothetical protein